MIAALPTSAKSAAIAALLQRGELSRSELAVLTGLSRASITEITQGLIRLGLLVERPFHGGEARRGRRSILLSLEASHACFVGISVADVSTLMVLTDLQGKLLARQPLPRFTTPVQLVAAVRKAYAQLLRSAGVPRRIVRGVGITVSGIIDHEHGICRYSTALNWKDVPISTMIGKAMGLPAWVDNDANAVALGEKFFGRARDFQHFTTVVLGRTIGAAHHTHGLLYRGHVGGAGEIGHITVDPGGASCPCGRSGCLDTIAGGGALRRAAAEHGLAISGVRDLEEMAAHGNAVAIRLLRHAGRALGTVIASVVQINNPECILFTDTEGFGSGVFRTATRQAIENSILPRFLPSTQIVFSQVTPDFLPRSASSIAAFEYLRTI